MPSPATGVTATKGKTSGGQRPVPVVPFIRASGEHREPTGIDVTRTMTGSDQNLGVFDIPAYGFVRNLVILVEATGGDHSAAGAAANEDAPFNAIKNIAFTEPNGAVIAQFDSGHDAYLANKWGGYRNPIGADPKASPAYSAVDGEGDFAYIVRIPVELNLRDALGALPNQNAAATFKLRASLAGSGDVYSTAPDNTLPDVRVRVFLEAWDQPESQTAGQSNQTNPPALNTTQFWTSQVYNVTAGQQTIRLTRIGNYIRNLVLVYRDGGVRADAEADWPDPLTFHLDTRPIDSIEDNSWKNQMWERTGFGGAGIANEAANGLDDGVRVIDFTHEFDGGLGRENRDLWLPTLGSTRLELQGNFGAAGTLTVLTNDVAIAGRVFI